MVILAFYWNYKQDKQRERDVNESGSDLEELDKRRKNIGLNLNYKLFFYIFIILIAVNIISRLFGI